MAKTRRPGRILRRAIPTPETIKTFAKVAGASSTSPIALHRLGLDAAPDFASAAPIAPINPRRMIPLAIDYHLRADKLDRAKADRWKFTYAGAAHFVFDKAANDEVDRLFREGVSEEAAIAMCRDARLPVERCAIHGRAPDGADAYTIFFPDGLRGEMIFATDIAGSSPIITVILDAGVLAAAAESYGGFGGGAAFDVGAFFFGSVRWLDREPSQSRADLDQDYAQKTIKTAIILMHLLSLPAEVAPQSRVPARRELGRGGKPHAVPAHTVVSINVAAHRRHVVEAVARVEREQAARREHGVRGHWVTLHPADGCAHAWEVDARVPDRQRYVCGGCGALRTWRREHRRGDASKGTIEHTYAVTAEKEAE